MATATGQAAVHAYMRQVKELLPINVLRGAARKAASIVAADARSRSVSPLVAAAIKVSTKVEPGRVIAKVVVRGKGAFMAPWLEYGTDPHEIRVGAARKGQGRRSLVIEEAFVGGVVSHPGARPHPFLRPALDTKIGEGIAAAQSYITTRLAQGGLTTPDAGDGEQ